MGKKSGLSLLAIAALVAITSTEVHAYPRGALQDWEPQATKSTARRLVGKDVPINSKRTVTEVKKAMPMGKVKLNPPKRGRSTSAPTIPRKKPTQNHTEWPSENPTLWPTQSPYRRTASESPKAKRVTWKLTPSIPRPSATPTSTFTLDSMARTQGRSEIDSIAAGKYFR